MPSNKAIGTVAVIAAAVAIAFFLYPRVIEKSSDQPITEKSAVFDPRNATYVIDGEQITLINGASERQAAPGSASKIVTRYFGNEASGDLNADGIPDSAFLLTQEGGGSGVFYYAVAVLPTSGGHKTTNTFFIGDRIAPQSTEIRNQELYVNFAQRKAGEPMSAPPSEGATLLLKVTPRYILEGLMK